MFIQIMLTDLAHSIEYIFLMSGELSQQLPAFPSWFAPMGTLAIGRKSTHYAIIDLTPVLWILFICQHMQSGVKERRKCVSNVFYILYPLFYFAIRTVIMETAVIWLANYRHPKFHDRHNPSSNSLEPFRCSELYGKTTGGPVWNGIEEPPRVQFHYLTF